MATKADVDQLILVAAPGANVSGIIQNGERVYGEFVSPVCQGMSIDDRQKWVDEHVRVPFGFEGTNVGVRIPLEPDEA